MRAFFRRLDDASPETRRARLLRFVDYAGGDNRRYAPRIGDRFITLNDLTDEALELLAEWIVADFWWSRRINRESRALAAGNQIGRAA